MESKNSQRPIGHNGVRSAAASQGSGLRGRNGPRIHAARCAEFLAQRSAWTSTVTGNEQGTLVDGANRQRAVDGGRP